MKLFFVIEKLHDSRVQTSFVRSFRCSIATDSSPNDFYVWHFRCLCFCQVVLDLYFLAHTVISSPTNRDLRRLEECNVFSSFRPSVAVHTLLWSSSSTAEIGVKRNTSEAVTDPIEWPNTLHYQA